MQFVGRYERNSAPRQKRCAEQGHRRRRNAAPSAFAAECGDRRVELLNWFALFATAGTPAPAIARRNEIANTALRDPAVAQKLEVQGIVPRPLTPAEFRAFVDAEIMRLGKGCVAARLSPV